jgi:ParB-like chromosome segregation protein Spo0J
MSRKKAQAKKSAPVVHCAHDEMVPIESLIPHPRNPNRHSEAQINLLAGIIAAQGWRNPITVSERSGFIVAGHARLLAAQKLGLLEVPVDRQPFTTEAEEWAYLISDNRIAELAERDSAMLKDLLQELDTGAFNMNLTGYDLAALEELMTQAAPPGEFPSVGSDITTQFCCPKCGYEWSGSPNPNKTPATKSLET